MEGQAAPSGRSKGVPAGLGAQCCKARDGTSPRSELRVSNDTSVAPCSPQSCLAVGGKEGEVHPHNVSLHRFLRGSLGHLRPSGRRSLCPLAALGQNANPLLTSQGRTWAMTHHGAGNTFRVLFSSALLGTTFQRVHNLPGSLLSLGHSSGSGLLAVPVLSMGTHLQWEHHKGHADQDDHQELGGPDLGRHITKAHS